MTIERIRELAGRRLRPPDKIWLVVGDGATQRDRLAALGLGRPVSIDREGRPTAAPGTN